MSTLTHFSLCPFSRSIRLALSELGWTFELKDETPWAWRPEFLELNPSGDLPVLQLAEGQVVAGAYAISEYLSDSVRSSPAEDRPLDIFSGSSENRCEIRRVVDWFNRKFTDEAGRDLLREKLHARMRSDLAASAPDPELMRALRANVRYHMSYVAYLADQRRWLAGDEMSFADLAAAAHLSCLDYIDEVEWTEFPAAHAWYSRMKSRPSFRPLLADRIPGIAPPGRYTDLDF
jgi:glutathione S-transferase